MNRSTAIAIVVAIGTLQWVNFAWMLWRHGPMWIVLVTLAGAVFISHVAAKMLSD